MSSLKRIASTSAFTFSNPFVCVQNEINAPKLVFQISNSVTNAHSTPKIIEPPSAKNQEPQWGASGEIAFICTTSNGGSARQGFAATAAAASSSAFHAFVE